MFSRYMFSLIGLLAAVSSLQIRKDVVEIENDVVVSVEGSVIYDSARNFVESLPFAPLPSQDSTKGILYSIDSDFNCIPTTRSNEYFSDKYIRIALIQSTSCSIKNQVQQAALDGSRGAIVYSENSTTPELKSFYSAQLDGFGVKIPVYIADSTVGTFLKRQLNEIKLENNFKSADQKKKGIFISLIPNPKKSNWYIVLISIVSAVLFACLMYILYSRLRSRKNSYDSLTDPNHTSSDPRKRNFSNSSVSKKLQVRRLTSRDIEKNTNRSSSLTSYLLSSDNINNSSRTFEYKHNNGLKGHTTCSMCLDDFIQNSKIRKLPCGHKFHTECIDPWLMKQSALCPICRYDTRRHLKNSVYSKFDNISLDQDKTQVSQKKTMGSVFKTAYNSAKNKISPEKSHCSRSKVPERNQSLERIHQANNSNSIRFSKPSLSPPFSETDIDASHINIFSSSSVNLKK
ncbi:Receptor homology region, transmembrane domain- and RING domain-containing protein 5 [Smittium mucronatum]|uniref:Receptor homology region, transmembrane domain-and RING domain-containing protein 5 n=1 Tax=Smittium mucronatum TaxID=133383 RepID=A0A1R0GT59_9FUNG|nr:Receptor homology region, transmembrane domain- and RING domain-containing protein 5 [Smittium mucronatum]